MPTLALRSSAGRLIGFLVGEAPAGLPALPRFGERNNPESLQDSPFMSDEDGGGGPGGEEMAERGSSSRKTGRGVKWRQVFHDKPYNPPPLPRLHFPPQTGPLRSGGRPENRHLFPVSLCSLTFFCFLLSDHLIRLI